MPFATKHLANVIVGEPFQLTLLEEMSTEASSGFDTLSLDYLLRDPSVRSLKDVLHFPRGSKLEGLDMWVTARSLKQVGDTLFRLRATSQGILSLRGRRISYSSSANNQNGDNISVEGTLYSRVQTKENTPTITIEEMFQGEIKNEIEGGVEADPPADALPDDPTTVWTFLTDPTFNFPNGWVKTQSAQGLPGVTTAWLLTTQYQWVHALQP